MSLRPIHVIDTRPLFRPVSRSLVTLLRSLSDDAWLLPTAAGTWRVRDVAAHLFDGTMRRLGFQRDRHVPPAPARPLASERDLAAFVSDLNARWLEVAERFSPCVLTDVYASVSEQWADYVEHLPIDAPALFSVSWAGEAEYSNAGWFDLGREFTELWHHQAQVRDAVGAPPLDDAAALRAFVAIAVLALPHAYRDVRRQDGDTLTLVIPGPSGGTWTLRRDRDRWPIWTGESPSPTARATMPVEVARRLLFNALPPEAAAAAITIEGDRELAAPLVNARSVIV